MRVRAGVRVRVSRRLQQLRHDGARGVLDVAPRELPEQPQRRALQLVRVRLTLRVRARGRVRVRVRVGVRVRVRARVRVRVSSRARAPKADLLPKLHLLLRAQAQSLGRLGLRTLRETHVRVCDAHGAAHLVRVRGSSGQGLGVRG